VKTIEFVVTGDPTAARAAVVKALESRKFRLDWSGEWQGTAERGKKWLNALAGAFAQYFKVELNVFSAEQGQSVIRLEKSSSGMMGGAVGVARTNKNFTALRDELSPVFSEQGILVGVRES
jgi:hypothetical protein